MNLNLTPSLDRRTFLRGAGALMALPWLESMMPRRLMGSNAAPPKPPVRLVFIHTESGMWMETFTPKTTGTGYSLTPTLEPLAPFRNDFSVCTGLFHAAAFKRNACGRHCQDTTCFLTGADLGAVPGVPTRNSVSVDQVAVRRLGDRTRFPHLHFSPGGIGSIVHSETGTPIPPETDPQAAFNRLFTDQSPQARTEARRRLALNQSILDDVLDAAHDLDRRLGTQDKAKLDEYLTHVREVERRTQVADKWLDQPAPAAPTGAKAPSASGTRTERIRALLDVAALALQTDQTRVVTLQIGGMGCMYPEIGASDGYHNYTHHDFKADRIAAMQKVDRHRVSHVAHFLSRLKSAKEGDRDLLFQSSILYGSGMGQTHEGTDIPNLLLGHGGGALHPGQHLDFKGKPLSNLFLTMLATAQVEEKRFADGTAPLNL
jgi:Protein of unknown function (DUF1552)